MEIYRKIFGQIRSESMKANLEDVLKEDLGWNYFSVDIGESTEKYALVKSYVEVYDLSDTIAGAVFTDKEILDAEIVQFIGARSFGYPEPQKNYLCNTYEDSCTNCGIHGRQIDNFQIKNEPKLKANSIGSLEWVYDEIFCTKELYQDFFKVLDVDFRDVSIKNKATLLPSIVQVVIPQLKGTLALNDLEFNKCSVCGRVKYTPSTTGFFALPEVKNFTIAKTKEFFGSGGSANNRILLNNDVMKRMLKRKMARKHQFIPCQ